MSDSVSVLKVSVEQELKKSFLDYAMSVIVGRAWPDVRDGLKTSTAPLYLCYARFRKLLKSSLYEIARIVGHVTGRYHPHGDVAAYDTIVRLAQPLPCAMRLLMGRVTSVR